MVTWRGAILQAHLPEDIQTVSIVNNDLTLHVKAGGRRLIIFTEGFSESVRMKAWLGKQIANCPADRVLVTKVRAC
jgi:hypothetical protein